MINNHLFPRGVSNSCSQRNPSQNNKAIRNVAIAYTSASTALYQKLSVKVNDKLAMTALPKIITALLVESSFSPTISFFNNMVNDQNIKSMVNALENTER